MIDGEGRHHLRPADPRVRPARDDRGAAPADLRRRRVRRHGRRRRGLPPRPVARGRPHRADPPDDREPRRDAVDGGRRRDRDRAAAAQPALAQPQQPGRQPPQHRRALRPRQRPLRADARRDHGLFLRRVRAGRRDPARGAAREVRAHLPQAAAGARGPPARDRHRLGRVRNPRREPLRLPRHHHHDLARAARLGEREDRGGRPAGPRHAAARRLPRPARAATTSWSRSR